MEYEARIGLETHVQLKTRTKMWCGCANAFGADPNTQVCPVCLGLPGVLPVANRRALELTALTGFLLNCEVAGNARFDRKNYFYPDVPKNYQVTQYALPSNLGGHVDFEFEGKIHRVHLTRAHLEEDVGKSFHFDKNSGVDFNRAGVPLLEIVSEPDLTSAEMACDYLNALKDILVHGGVSDCDMEKGMVRCDVNVSVRPKGQSELGAKIEIKNMNSFSGVRRALLHEIPRQIETLESGGRLSQETRRWDDDGGVTEPMRAKEEAHDYRYFPEPDLMPFQPGDDWKARIRSQMAELPLARKQRFMTDYGLPSGDAEVFVNDVALGDYFERTIGTAQNRKAAANWIINNMRAQITEKNVALESVKIQPAQISQLISLVESGKISGKIAQQVFAEMFDTGRDPESIVEAKGLVQVSDAGAIEQLCGQVIAENPKSADDFRSGKPAALNFLKGQVMRLSKGKANPQLVGEVLEKKLRD